MPLYLSGASQLTKQFAIFFICFFYSQGWTDFTQDRTARHKQAGLGLRGTHMQFRLNAFLRTKGVTMWRAIKLKSGKGDFFLMSSLSLTLGKVPVLVLLFDRNYTMNLRISMHKWSRGFCIPWTMGMCRY